MVPSLAALLGIVFGFAHMVTSYTEATFGIVCFAFYPTLCLYLRRHYEGERRTNFAPRFVAALLPFSYLLMYLSVFLAICALSMLYFKDERDPGILLFIACPIYFTGMFLHMFTDGLRRPDMSGLMARRCKEIWPKPDKRTDE